MTTKQLPEQGHEMLATGKDLQQSNEITAYTEVVEPRELETIRALKPRQMAMIALGGSIGTGLVVGSGSALVKAGPGSLLVAYIMVGVVTFSLICALGEMSTKFPTKKGFSGHATRCVDPAFGFTVALSYLCKYLIISPFQIVAGALVIQFWNQSISPAVFCSITVVAVFAINLLGIKWFGELEFWLSSVKILTLSGLILLGLIIDLGGVPSQPRIGFRYWEDDKAFKAYKVSGNTGRFLGFFSALVSALFAFMGTELVGITVGEAKNPRKSVPSAIRKTFARIVVFYVGGIFVIGLVVDSSSKLLAQATAKGTAGGASASPFVVAIQAAGIKTLPNIINACIYLFTFSAANSDQYIATRTLYGMAKDGLAPRIFTKCTTRGVPWVAFVATGSFMGLSFLCASSSALTIFNNMVSTVVTMAALAWISILGTHISFMRGMKAQGISRQTLPYKSPFQPYLSYYGLLMTIIITIFKGFDAFMPFNYKSFVTNYIGLLVYGFGYAYYKLRYRTRRVSLRDMDLSTDAAEFDGDEVDLPDGGDAQSKLSIFSIWHNIRNW